MIAGFRACGVCPLDQSLFEVTTDEANNSVDSDVDCSLPFVPLLTPMKKREVTQTEVLQSDDDTVGSFSKQTSLSSLSERSCPTSSTVLTSMENLRMLAKQKHEKEEQKQQRRTQRKKKRQKRRKQYQPVVSVGRGLAPAPSKCNRLVMKVHLPKLPTQKI